MKMWPIFFKLARSLRFSSTTRRMYFSPSKSIHPERARCGDRKQELKCRSEAAPEANSCMSGMGDKSRLDQCDSWDWYMAAFITKSSLPLLHLLPWWQNGRVVTLTQILASTCPALLSPPYTASWISWEQPCLTSVLIWMVLRSGS